MRRKLSREDRLKITKRFLKRQQKRAVPKAVEVASTFYMVFPDHGFLQIVGLNMHFHSFSIIFRSVHWPPGQVYHTRVKKTDGTLGWQGGKDLAESALFTWQFCKELLGCWKKQQHVVELSSDDSLGPNTPSKDSAASEILVLSSQEQG